METESVDPSDPAVPAIQSPDGPTIPRSAKPSRAPLLSDALKQPLILLWVALLPGIVLLLLNLRDYRLISGELQPPQRSACIQIALFELGLIAGVTVLAAAFRFREKLLPWGVCWAL